MSSDLQSITLFVTNKKSFRYFFTIKLKIITIYSLITNLLNIELVIRFFQVSKNKSSDPDTHNKVEIIGKYLNHNKI